MTITKIPTPSHKFSRLQQLERLTYTITLNGVELCALAQLARKVGGLPDTTYRKYTQPFSEWFERQDFLFDAGDDHYFSSATITAQNLPK